jgi:flagellar protein FliS
MTNNEYINAYKKTQQSSNTETSSHEIVRTLMKELVNSMQKIVLDIQDDRSKKVDKFTIDKAQEEKITRNKSKNLSKSLSIIYGLQTSLDFDKALEIANNLFQLYEYCRQEIIKGFSQKIEDGIIKAIDIIKQIMEGWEEIPSLERQDG